MKLLKFFLPKDRIFLTLFHQVGQHLLEISTLLDQFIAESDEVKKAALFKEIHDVERKNDALQREMNKQLSIHFITPFDREDIHNLSNELEEVIDCIYAAAKQLTFYKLPTNDPFIVKAIAPILEGTNALVVCLDLIKDPKHRCFFFLYQCFGEGWVKTSCRPLKRNLSKKASIQILVIPICRIRITGK